MIKSEVYAWVQALFLFTYIYIYIAIAYVHSFRCVFRNLGEEGKIILLNQIQKTLNKNGLVHLRTRTKPSSGTHIYLESQIMQHCLLQPLVHTKSEKTITNPRTFTFCGNNFRTGLGQKIFFFSFLTEAFSYSAEFMNPRCVVSELYGVQ